MPFKTLLKATGAPKADAMIRVLKPRAKGGKQSLALTLRNSILPKGWKAEEFVQVQIGEGEDHGCLRLSKEGVRHFKLNPLALSDDMVRVNFPLPAGFTTAVGGAPAEHKLDGGALLLTVNPALLAELPSSPRS